MPFLIDKKDTLKHGVREAATGKLVMPPTRRAEPPPAAPDISKALEAVAGAIAKNTTAVSVLAQPVTQRMPFMDHPTPVPQTPSRWNLKIERDDSGNISVVKAIAADKSITWTFDMSRDKDGSLVEVYATKK